MARLLRRRYGRASSGRTRAYNVYLNGRLIETVWQHASGRNKAERQDDVKRSLVDHDGYDSDIKVVEGK